jgi:hypothetical protein
MPFFHSSSKPAGGEGSLGLETPSAGLEKKESLKMATTDDEVKNAIITLTGGSLGTTITMKQMQIALPDVLQDEINNALLIMHDKGLIKGVIIPFLNKRLVNRFNITAYF